MQHHDLVAELDGYRNALESAKRYGDKDQAKAIEAEVGRVTADIRATIDHHETQAGEHDGNGQHTLGAQAREKATRLRRALGEDAPAAENTAQNTPTEKAVTPKK